MGRNERAAAFHRRAERHVRRCEFAVLDLRGATQAAGGVEPAARVAESRAHAFLTVRAAGVAGSAALRFGQCVGESQVGENGQTVCKDPVDTKTPPQNFAPTAKLAFISRLPTKVLPSDISARLLYTGWHKITSF